MVYPELAKELNDDRIEGNTMVNLSALEAIFKDTVKMLPVKLPRHYPSIGTLNCLHWWAVVPI